MISQLVSSVVTGVNRISGTRILTPALATPRLSQRVHIKGQGTPYLDPGAVLLSLNLYISFVNFADKDSLEGIDVRFTMNAKKKI